MDPNSSGGNIGYAHHIPEISQPIATTIGPGTLDNAVTYQHSAIPTGAMERITRLEVTRQLIDNGFAESYGVSGQSTPSINPSPTRPPSPSKKKKKVSVIEAIILGTKTRLEKNKKDILEQSVRQQMEEKDLKQKKQNIEKIEIKIKELKNRCKELNKNKAELKKHYQTVIDRLLKDGQISSFDTDMYQRVIVTTKPISISKPGWLTKNEAGIYKIRIDFDKDYFCNAIQILNITRSYSGFDSPTIQNTHPCWGNIGPDIENDFNAQDLYELVKDLIDYIQSPNTQDGYLGKDGDRTKGWELFFDKAVLRPADYLFPDNSLSVVDETITMPSVWGQEYRTVTHAHVPIREDFSSSILGRAVEDDLERRESLSLRLNREIARLGFINHEVVTRTILNNMSPNDIIRGGRLSFNGSGVLILEILFTNRDIFSMFGSARDLESIIRDRLEMGEVLNFRI
jgi:hypothetical protein